MAQLTGLETFGLLGQSQNGAPAASTETVTSIHANGSGTRVTAALTNIVSTTTMANIANLSVGPLVAGKTYIVEAQLPITSTAGGVALALNTSDTLSMTSMNLTGSFFTASGVAVANTTTFGGGVGSTVTCVLAALAGAFVVNTAGTLVLQAAQNASNAATTVIAANGFLRVTRVI